MTDPIIYVDRSRIREGSVERVRQQIQELAAFIESEEPRLIGYEFYFDDEATQMTVIAIHPDTQSLETHMRIGRDAFRQFAELIDMQSIEVYGQPSAEVLRLLDEKSRMLGTAGRVEVHDRQGGFTRL